MIGHRLGLAARASVVATDTFGLLARYGRDVAGALVVVVDPDTDPARAGGSVEPLDDDALAEEVARLPDHPLGIHDDSELSLAGLQDKMLLVDLGAGRWGRPVGGMPSTHILKADHRVYRGIVAAETEALALARAAGLTSVSSELRRIGELDCLIVSRFDRTRDDAGKVVRVHQEDACQALGLPPTQKYEIRQGGRGPELSQLAGLLDAHSHEPLVELDRLASMATFTSLIGNADAHGKNIALLHTAPGRVRLAPLYDIVPTVLWPNLSADAAMTIGGSVNLAAVNPATIAREAKLWRHSPTSAVDAASAVTGRLLEALDDGVIDPAGKLGRLVRRRASAFLRAAP